MAPEPILIHVLSDLVTDINRRGISYALAGGWVYVDQWKKMLGLVDQ
jgi:hypothetical protein